MGITRNDNDIIVGVGRGSKKNKTKGNEMFGVIISIFGVSKCVLLWHISSYECL